MSGIALNETTAAARGMASRSIAPQDDLVPVESGGWPWKAIGRLERKIGGYCTATLIAPNAVLTAAHCLFDRASGRELSAPEVRFLSGYDEGRFTSVTYAEGIIRTQDEHAQKTPQVSEMATDWAVVVLRRSLPIQPMPVRSLPEEACRPSCSEVPFTVSQIGFSGNQPGELVVDASCRLVARDPKDLSFMMDCETLKGDSGGPLLHDVHGNSYLVGVTSGRVTDSQGQTHGIAVHAGAILKALATVNIPGVALPSDRPGQ